MAAITVMAVLGSRRRHTFSMCFSVASVAEILLATNYGVASVAAAGGGCQPNIS
jgi:hypothetical protein